MNLKTTERLANRNIEGLHIATGGLVVVAPLASSIPDEYQPSNSKVLYVFGIAIAALLIGAAVGWFLNAQLTQSAKEKAEMKAMAAQFNLQQNQAAIDNFCKQNSTLIKK